MHSITHGQHRFTHLTRADWNAGPLRHGHVVPAAQFVGIASHHTVMDPDDPLELDDASTGNIAAVGDYMRRLQAARPDLGSEVPYSAVIFPGATPLDAVIADGRGKGVTGAHTAGRNSTLYGFAWAANTNDDPVTPGMVAAFRWLAAQWLTDPVNAARTIGHFEVDATECPGDSGKAMLAQMQPPFAGSTIQDGLPPAALKRGDKGVWVERWQQLCNALVAAGIATDGLFGPATQQATIGVERALGFATDGVVSVDQYRIARQAKQQQDARMAPRPIPIPGAPKPAPVIDDKAMIRGHVVAALEDCNQIRARLNAILTRIES